MSTLTAIINVKNRAGRKKKAVFGKEGKNERDKERKNTTLFTLLIFKEEGEEKGRGRKELWKRAERVGLLLKWRKGNKEQRKEKNKVIRGREDRSNKKEDRRKKNNRILKRQGEKEGKRGRKQKKNRKILNQIL